MESSRNTTICSGSFPGQVEGRVRTVDKERVRAMDFIGTT
jgi:hypothetical protein